MKVICNQYKNCKNENCPHSIPHDKSFMCKYKCDTINEHTKCVVLRKEKLEILNNLSKQYDETF